MTLVEIPSYRIVCDGEGCTASPADNSDFYCWAQPDGAYDDMASNGTWYSKDDTDLCPEHAPRCKHEDCEVQLHDDEFGEFCEDHAPEETP